VVSSPGYREAIVSLSPVTTLIAGRSMVELVESEVRANLIAQLEHLSNEPGFATACRKGIALLQSDEEWKFEASERPVAASALAEIYDARRKNPQVDVHDWLGVDAFIAKTGSCNLDVKVMWALSAKGLIYICTAVDTGNPLAAMSLINRERVGA